MVGTWSREERREGVKLLLQALAERPIGRRDQASAWLWRLAEYSRDVHEEYAVQRWPETKRLLGLLVNSSGGAHARNARRLVQAARKQDRRLQAALLAAALAHTPEAEEVLRGARQRLARKPSALARELLRNFPKGRRRGRQRRRKGGDDGGGGAGTGKAGAAKARAAVAKAQVDEAPSPEVLDEALAAGEPDAADTPLPDDERGEFDEAISDALDDALEEEDATAAAPDDDDAPASEADEDVPAAADDDLPARAEDDHPAPAADAAERVRAAVEDAGRDAPDSG
jgi:hypothetical protein